MTIKRLQIIFLFFLVCLFSLLITKKINLVTADLGRHIKNGEMILSGKTAVLKTNFYSYTYTNSAFINHHWGSGVIFYLINKAFGFSGLSIFFTLIFSATFLLFFLIAWKSSRFGFALLASIIAIPIFVSRVEVRPEGFSYLFSAVFFWILLYKRKYLWLLPILEIIWINLHVYFFLGLLIIGVFFLEELISYLIRREKEELKRLFQLLTVGVASVLASLINPAFVKGTLYPLQIFKNYGYRLFENQSVLFLDKLIAYVPNLYFKIAFTLLILSWIFVFLRRQKVSIHNLIFSIFFSYLGWTAVRNFTLFGLFLIPAVAENFSGIIKEEETKKSNEFLWLEFFISTSFAVLLIVAVVLVKPSYWQEKVTAGIGLEEGNEKAAQFFIGNSLKGPVFNNYDNGGYLIYYLYPKEKVFVDNRPEAYTVDFFRNIYIPMQESNEMWGQEDKKYNFNVIFFHRNDLTPWGQTFLVSRIQDPNWVPVYVDNWQIIFLKKNKENEKLIEKFELPKEMFSINKG